MHNINANSRMYLLKLSQKETAIENLVSNSQFSRGYVKFMYHECGIEK